MPCTPPPETPRARSCAIARPGSIDTSARGAIESFTTPDGRPGAIVQLHVPRFRKDRVAALERAALVRISQNVLTCPTAACFNLIDSANYFHMGRKVAYFGDGFQKRIERFGRKMWWIPTLGGEFILDRRLGYADGLMGGNLWFMGETEDAALAAAEAGVAAVRDCPGVIMPFPGGIAGSGSKAGSKYRFAVASTYEKFCPLLDDDPAAKSELPENVGSVMEIIINGRDLNAIIRATQAAISCLGEYARVAADLGGQLRRPARQELRLSPSRQTAWGRGGVKGVPQFGTRAKVIWLLTPFGRGWSRIF